MFNTLSGSLHTGFIDKLVESNKEYRPEFLCNNPSEGKKVLTSVLKKLESCDEFWFSVAFVTTSGIATLINTLIDLEEAGIKGKILASQYLNFTQPEALKRILQFSNVDLRIATEGDFHSKGYLFKKNKIYDLIIGSSNLTQSALTANREWNLKVSASIESDLILQTLAEFDREFKAGKMVTKEFLVSYELIFNSQKELNRRLKAALEIKEGGIVPNSMQVEALKNINDLRAQGKNKALLISATGTGKTYLSAFDVQSFNPKKFLFVVHRRTIANEAMRTFKSLFNKNIKMGLYSGSHQEMNADFLFSTVQTISKTEHLRKFAPNHFDYIVIDETHRAGAASYNNILEHFTPKFLLGMTATPERTDGLDIFKMFDYNIAYEIRLHRAMEEEMLSPFHYYGVTDLTINGEEIDDKTDFNRLTSNERIKRILEKATLFGTDDGVIRGLVFCSSIDECKTLSQEFNLRGFKSLSLTGENSEEERAAAIRKLESKNLIDKLDYIFTVDIFNEGIDIPCVNQIIMLRPTQSAIIFVQQLGRGLRKSDAKTYLTVIDFIGNYSNNYLVPIALYGDTSYNKDSLRKIMASGSRLVPGSSTINFDKIAKEKIFQAIASANMQKKKDLLQDYNLLKFKLGHYPMMMDFQKHGSRDPQLYADYSRSYFNFVKDQEDTLKDSLDSEKKKLLELFSQEINNSKRIEESLILKFIIEKGKITISDIQDYIHDIYGYHSTFSTIESAIHNLNFAFVTERRESKLQPVQEIYDLQITSSGEEEIKISNEFSEHLKNEIFKKFLIDSTNYSIDMFNVLFEKEKFFDGFVLYRKYSRKDVFRILKWKENPLAQNVGGYMVAKDKRDCAIFVNYHKEETISESTKYEDEFLSPSEFQWMSKSNRTLKSPEIQLFRNFKKTKIRLPLFIKKNNDEGSEFYYMGEMEPIEGSYGQTSLPSNNDKYVSVVKMIFKLTPAVNDEIYEYLISNG